MTERERELEAALREIGKIAHARQRYWREIGKIAHAMLEVAGRPQDRLPGAVLQANSDGTISKVEAP